MCTQIAPQTLSSQVRPPIVGWGFLSVSGRHVEVLLKHFVAAPMFFPRLSSPRSLKMYVRVNSRHPKSLKLHITTKIKLFSLNLHIQLPLIQHVCTRIMATDPSNSGLGVSESWSKHNDVVDVGSWQGRWRSRRLEPLEWALRFRILHSPPELTDPRPA